jgi:hypothetical protein
MDYTTFLEENKGENACASKQMQSLYEACHQLQDGRKARGKQYDLAGVLLVMVLAKLAGMNSLLAASEWVKDQEQIIRANVNLSWKRMPCANTYSYVLAHLESQQVNAHLASWFVHPGMLRRKGETHRDYSSTRCAAPRDPDAGPGPVGMVYRLPH